ncbi:MAG: glycerol-3-phosphate 1-O-acyltransferase [Bacteroidia bacterium]|nr:MAG: glycerol-3-phosphate 1-O-acyltransferase [Bacteroidia bacterium]
MIMLVILAYLLGSLPTAVWIGKWFRGLDVREHGSGNAGATNAMRVLGTKIAIIVLVIDAMKGIAAVSLASVLPDESFKTVEWFIIFQMFLGAMAIVGHVFPVFAGFKGGKGIATLVGITFILFPEAFLICLAIFLLLFLTTRYVSLGSLSAAIALPVIVIWVKDVTILPKVIFAIAIAIFVPITHINNIRRLMKGAENRISFSKKK